MVKITVLLADESTNALAVMGFTQAALGFAHGAPGRLQRTGPSSG